MEPVIPSTKISELFNITGKVVLIVGAGGMGRVIAKAFADNGARIAVATRSQSSLDITRDLFAESGAEQRYYIMHVENKAEVEEVVEEINKDFGRIDILIFTSAIAPLGPSLDFDEKDFRDTMEINFMGSVFVNAACGRIMAKNGWGRIININSIDGFTVNCVDDLPYSASKAAMMASTRHLAVDLATYGVTVNGIAPVWIWTPMMERRPKDYMVQAAASIPMGRVSYTEDYLGMIFFLSSDASAYVTGQTFLVDGGRDAYRSFHYEGEEQRPVIF